MRRSEPLEIALAAFAALFALAAQAEIKALLCTGDYGMWAQDRATAIRGGVEQAAPGAVSFEVEQTYNFVRKLEAPGYAGRFDVIAVGDVALGQMTTRAQAALVKFVGNGGGLVYVVWAKSSLGFQGSRAVEPLPLAAILPYAYPDSDPLKHARADARGIAHTAAPFKGLDFAGTPLLAPDKEGSPRNPVPPLALERAHGKGKVVALYGVFGPGFRKVAYGKHERIPGGWDAWPQAGECWARVLKHAAANSPVLGLGRTEVDAARKPVTCTADVAVDATKAVDDVRAAVFSIVALQQLYNEDSGNGEEAFLELNPQDWYDRRTQEVLSNTKGIWPDKPALFRHYSMKGIIMAGASYGSHAKWDDQKWQAETRTAIDSARQYPDILTFLQPGNEPHCGPSYYDFYNRYAASVLKEAPALKVIGPGVAWNLYAPNEQQFKAFIDACGQNTDILNWHIYARPPANVRDQVKYWSKYAEGRLRTKGPARVMFTEADAWNTRESQFNYLLDRAFTFLPMPEIVACFQYCMRPRYEGGTYWFDVLMAPAPRHVKPEGEFAANYNGYWIFRNLRGKLVETKAAVVPAAAADNCHVLASVSKDGKTVTVVAHYDTGYVGMDERADAATFRVNVKLPSGRYVLERSDCTWSDRKAVPATGAVSGTVTVDSALAPSTAVAWTWRRQAEKEQP